MARNSAFSYRGRATDVRGVSQELGVRYVVEGSVALSGLRLRASAKLIDAVSGAHVWAERFDRTLRNSVEVRDGVTRAVVAAIAPQIEGL